MNTFDAVQQELKSRFDNLSLNGGTLSEQDEWRLCTEGKLSENDLLDVYETASSFDVADDDLLDSIRAFDELSAAYLRQWTCIPYELSSDQIGLLIAIPYQCHAISTHWEHLYDKKVQFKLARRSVIERLIHKLYEEDELTRKLEANAQNSTEEALIDMAKEAPIVRLVNDMFSRAVEMRASDIHVEPSEKELAIRFRIDGILQTVMNPPIVSYPAIASRLKLIAGLNIAESRLPQDGRTDLRIGTADIDVRVSTIPSMQGESIVLRILRKDMKAFTLDKIGMSDALTSTMRSVLSQPHGLILVVGPTGSGKTTSLYCALQEMNAKTLKVITIEDPVEYQMDDVTQMQVKSSIGLNFADGLRHIVRQDPDVIMVGEIRDKETADIAIHAALTGHLVLSTLHTNDAAGAVTRLQDMGVDSFLISSSLLGVLSQRLVRTVCTDCGGTGKLDDKDCRFCNGTAYHGRIGIYEWLPVSEKIRKAINDRKDAVAIFDLAKADGMMPILDDGLSKVESGKTKREEVLRVCQLGGME